MMDIWDHYKRRPIWPEKMPYYVFEQDTPTILDNTYGGTNQNDTLNAIYNYAYYE